jgi:hypothetical protein
MDTTVYHEGHNGAQQEKSDENDQKSQKIGDRLRSAEFRQPPSDIRVIDHSESKAADQGDHADDFADQPFPESENRRYQDDCAESRTNLRQAVIYH